MSRKLEVIIAGDASSLERALGRSSAETQKFGGAMGKLAGVAKVAGAAIVGGVAVGLEKSIHAAVEAQSSQARLAQAFKNVGLSADAYEGKIKKAEEASAKLGFTEEDVHTSLGSLVTATGSVTKSMQELQTAQDIARFKGVALTDATKMLTMAQTGSQRAAKQLGINVSAVTSHVDALKASHLNTATAAGKLELAHAKLLDKMATGNAVIDAVKAKVKGQADAFSQTAAGGMEAFKAQLNALEIRIGTALIPALSRAITALTSLMDWLSHSPAVAQAASIAMQVFGDVLHVVAVVGEALLGFYNRHKTASIALIGALAAIAIAFSGPTVWISAVGVALVELWKRSETFRDVVHAAFNAVKNVVDTVFPTIKAVITQTVSVIEALWRQFGGTIVSVITTAVHGVEGIVRGLATMIGGVFSLIGDLIHGRWSKLWGDLKQIVSGAFDALEALVRAEAKIVWTLAVELGKSLVSGIISGLGDIASSVGGHIKSGLSGAFSGIRGAFKIHSPSGWTSENIGKPLAQGITLGFVNGMSGFGKIVSDVLDSAFVEGVKQIRGWVKQVGGLAQFNLPTGLQQAAAWQNKTQTDAANAALMSDWQQAIFAGTAGVNRSGGPDDRISIPGFADGGVVPGAPGAPRLVVAHGGETITPPGRGVTELHVHIGTVIGTTLDKAADELWRALREKGRLNGGLSFT